MSAQVQASGAQMSAKGIVKLAPAHLDVLRVVGYQYLKTGQFHKAERVFVCLHRQLPQHAQIAASLAFSLFHRGDYSGVLHVQSAFEEQGSTTPKVLQMLVMQALLRLQRKDEARQLWRRLLLAPPKTGDKPIPEQR